MRGEGSSSLEGDKVIATSGTSQRNPDTAAHRTSVLKLPRKQPGQALDGDAFAHVERRERVSSDVQQSPGPRGRAAGRGHPSLASGGGRFGFLQGA